MASTSNGQASVSIGRRSSVELGLVITLLIGVSAAVASYMDVRAELGSINAHLNQTWTAAHQHVWIEMANDSIEQGKPLPTVRQVRSVLRNIENRQQ